MAQGSRVSPDTLSVNDALRYLDQVRSALYDQPDVHQRFLMIFKDFRDAVISTSTCMTRMGELFITSGHPELIDGFNTFLPSGYAVQQPTSPIAREVRVTTPHGPIISTLGP
ncbi:hypothetical protein PUNSTDRAFT_55996 [Punctularia strigosozonata HHB-11173 SS5]|uniref:PAH2 domain-containing protein n=1 Tax=Punctularia strigosozonata (strain HHB-11173) TaxID=741275 RepID=R7S1U5_PUNST|nr:uncharacterized protein PUNSTDRAFT_55996 [Punctularia strigosozonata HHB-11173 SS5]EIN03732.1 hypothetical protein PUNSTDRAFT_55996 [Punctularia strigosozonata HHB-11173 SS5]